MEMQKLMNAIAKVEVDFYDVCNNEEKDSCYDAYLSTMEEVNKQLFFVVRDIGFDGDYEKFKKMILDIRSK